MTKDGITTLPDSYIQYVKSTADLMTAVIKRLDAHDNDIATLSCMASGVGDRVNEMQQRVAALDELSRRVNAIANRLRETERVTNMHRPMG